MAKVNWTPLIWGVGAVYDRRAEQRGSGIYTKPWEIRRGSLYWDNDLTLVSNHHTTHELASIKTGSLRLFDGSELTFEARPKDDPFFWRRVPEIASRALGVSPSFYPDDYQEEPDRLILYRGYLAELTLTRNPAFQITLGRIGIDFNELQRSYHVPGQERRLYDWKFLYNG